MEWLAAIPPGLVFVVVFCAVAIESLGLPLPGETTLTAGVLVTIDTHGSVWLVALAAAAGAVLGDSIGYLLGRRFGPRLFEVGALHFPSIFSVKRIEAAVGLMRRHGFWAVFIGRFLAILRVFAGPLAGALGMQYRRFIVANVLGALVWAFGITTLVNLLGRAAAQLIHGIAWAALIVIGVAVLVGLIVALSRARRRAADAASDPDDTRASIRQLLAVTDSGVLPGEDGPVARRVLAGLGARTFGRAPFTWSFVTVFVIVGLVAGSAWRPLHLTSWYTAVAYGLPAFQDGRWWTLFTGTILAENPLYFSLTLALGAVSLGWLEHKRGTRVTAIYFAIGQVVAVLATAGFLAVFAQTGWPWAVGLSKLLDTGPSGGLFLALVVAAAGATSPWRLRWRLGIGVYLLVSLLLFGGLAEVEHGIVGIPALILLFGNRPTRPSLREWRLVASAILIAVGVIEILVALVPTHGPFGTSVPTVGNGFDVLLDIVVIVVVTAGIHRGRRIAWWIVVVLASFNILQGALVILALVSDAVTAVPSTDVGIALTEAILWAIVFAVMFAGRGAFRVPLFRRRSRAVDETGELAHERNLQLLTEYGGGSISWMSTWPEMRYFVASGGRSSIAFQRHSGVTIALGDPIGPESGRADAIAEFATAAEAAGNVPCFFSADPRSRGAAPATWRSLEVAQDAILDLPGLELTGKRWQHARSAVNRGEREGIAFELVSLAEQPWAVRAQVRAISEGWVGDKGLPEMRFTLGGVEEAMDPHVRVALAMDADRSVHGLLSWLPVYGPGGVVRGWTLDLMRRRDGGFPPVMEFLVTSSALAFKEEGAQYLSLSGAPLAREDDGDGPEDDPIQGALGYLGRLLEPVYGFQSLHRFKQKFNPRFEPMYLLYRDEADLPRIGQGLVRAFLPKASALDLARAGLQLSRR